MRRLPNIRRAYFSQSTLNLRYPVVPWPTAFRHCYTSDLAHPPSHLSTWSSIFRVISQLCRATSLVTNCWRSRICIARNMPGHFTHQIFWFPGNNASHRHPVPNNKQPPFRSQILRIEAGQLYLPSEEDGKTDAMISSMISANSLIAPGGARVDESSGTVALMGAIILRNTIPIDRSFPQDRSRRPYKFSIFEQS